METGLGLACSDIVVSPSRLGQDDLDRYPHPLAESFVDQVARFFQRSPNKDWAAIDKVWKVSVRPLKGSHQTTLSLL